MSKRRAVWATLVVCAFGCGNAGPTELSESVTRRSQTVILTCNSTAKVLDVQGDLHGLWTGAEVPSSGRRANPQTLVTVNFDISTQAQSVAGSFVPLQSNGSCGTTVPAAVSASLLPASIWGSAPTDAGRPALPAPYSVLAEEWIRGVPSIAGPIAAGSDITLSNFNVNTTARQPVGMIAGTQVNLSNGTLTGDVTYGTASTIPSSVTVSGIRSLQAFAVANAFQNLRSISTLLSSRVASGTTTFNSGTLTLSGQAKPLNTFKVTAAQMSQTSTLKISVPTGASAVIQVDGSSVDLSNKGIILSGITASTLLWNLPTARSLSINSIGIPGSILAPQARVQFNGGSIAGTLVARSLMTKSGSSITYAPLNIGLVFDAWSPSALVLTPASPLQRKCQYQFQLIASASGFCLQNPPTVPFFVSDYPSTAASRELSDVQNDPSLKNLRTFAVRQGVNSTVDEAFGRYQSEIGISRLDLVASNVSGPSFSRKNHVDTDYQQYAQGYLVRGYGYTISTEGAFIRSAVGKVAPSLPNFADPQLTSPAALQKALAALKITQPSWQRYPAKYSAPVGSLLINESGTSFRLVWLFDFAASGMSNPSSVAVDAASGVLASVEPGIRSGTQWLASGATYVEPVSDLLIDTPYNSQQKFTAGKFRNANNTEVTTLATGKLDDPGVFTASSGVSYDQMTGVLSGTRTYPLGPWLEPEVEPTNEAMASALWGLERANGFMQTLNLVANGPWVTIDGAKRQRVRLNGIPWVGTAKIGAFYAASASDEDDAQFFFTFDGPLTSVDADIVAHEYAHALVHNMGKLYGRKNGISAVGESGSIGEGISDFFAVASNNIAVALDPDAVSIIEPHSLWHCLLRPVGNGVLECLSNLKNPNDGLYKIVSTDPAGQPHFYLDTKANRYQNFSGITCTEDNDQCGAHLNSTIVSHWAYLTALGTVGVNSVPCGLTIKPLDSSDIDNSLRLTLALALRASTKIRDSGAKFADFRDASIRVAKDLLAENIFTDPKQVQTVLLAWDAVGLPPESSEWTSPSTPSRPSDVLPTDGAQNVDPWGPFVWSVTGHGQEGSSWDFQISDSADFKAILHHKEGITSRWDAEDWNPQRVYYQVALPPNDPRTFFWRVRPTPASNSNPLDPWRACYPIHSIRGTGDTPTVSDLAVNPSTLDADGVSAIPGQVVFTWTAPRYSPVSFDTTLSTNAADPGCSVATPGSHSVFGNDVMFADPLLPQADYWVGVRAVGPMDLSGKPTLSNCVSKRVHTGHLPKPNIVSPALVPYPLTFRFSDEVTFRFEGKGSPTKVRLDFMELDDKENCSSEIKFHKEVAYEPLGAGMSSSFGEVTTIFPDGNPTGYCFTATSIVGAVESEPSVQSRFIFTTSATPISPGIPYYDSASYANPALLSPADSYGKSVTFSWTPDPRAYGYRLRVGRWERRTYPITELSPKNCDGGFDCAKPPRIIFEDFVTGTSKMLPGVRADASTDCGGPSCGRYIWTVWPVYEDPENRGHDWLRQPKVALKVFAYSSGPSKPIVVVDSPSAYHMTSEQSSYLELPYGYNYGEIGFHVHYQYVPDQQFKVFDGNSNAQLAGPGDCPSQANGLVFNDVYNCNLPTWTLMPTPHTYSALPFSSGDFGRIRLPVWNSNNFTPNVPPGQAVGTPVVNDGNRVSNETVTFRRQVCGSYNQICCPFAGNGTSFSDTPEEKCPISGTPLVTEGTNDCICRGCGFPTTECCLGTLCDDGSACVAGKCPGANGNGSGSGSGSCANNTPNQAPTFIPTMTAYQNPEYCTPIPGLRHVDTGIEVPQCTITVDKMKELAAQGIQACVGPHLTFGWNAVPGASSYQVYVEDKKTGAFTNKHLVSTASGDWGVDVKDGEEPQIYQIVVRAETGLGVSSASGMSCLKQGDYAVANIMVASKCP
jgi:choice-of-anchor A domain-containing protein